MKIGATRGCLLVAVLVPGALQIGCVSAKLAPAVVSYNLAVEKSQNEMLLLNVVRAAKWQPMYLTDTGKITASIKRDLTASVTAPFGSLHGGTAANFGTTAGGTYSVNPSFEVNVLDTQEFMKGFLQPIAAESLQYFWYRGWPRELLLHLFVMQVDEGSGTEVKTYRNWPHFGAVGPTGAVGATGAVGSTAEDVNKDLIGFSEWVTNFLAEDPSFVPCEPPDSNVGPPVAADTLKKDLTPLISAAKEGLTLEEVDVDHKVVAYQLKRSQKGVGIAFGASAGGQKAMPCGKGGLGPGLLMSTEAGEPKPVSLHLRSPQDVLFYLGQIVRLEKGDHQVPQVLWAKGHGKYEQAPLFVAIQQNEIPAAVKASLEAPLGDSGQLASRCARPAVVAKDADEDRFIIPGTSWPPAHFPTVDTRTGGKLDYAPAELTCEAGFSVDVLSIMTQLIALQKSAKDFPSAGVVRVIGQ